MTTRARVVMGVILAVALVMLGYAFSISRDEDAPIVRDSAIVATSPRPGARVLRQETVFVELTIPHEARLTLDGQQVEPRVIQTGDARRFYYDPPEGRLASGTHRVVVQYWQPSDPAAVRTYSWSFEVT